jgi:general secretion pathway protein B
MNFLRLSPGRPACIAGAVLLALPALAQVSTPEPFGGRPFGAPPGTPSVQQQRQQEALQQQQMQQQAAAAPTVVQVLPNATLPAAVPQQPMQQPQPPASVGPGAAIQASRTTGQLQGSPAQQQALGVQQAPVAAPQPVQPPPGTMTPPFGRNAPPGTAAAPAAPAVPQQPVRGLPADAPKLVVTGSVYSPNPGNRLLIVNGQVYREGADLGQGVVLEQVHKDSAVLGFRGTKYNVLF